MSYDNKFYELYAEYLKEPTVRKNHDRVFWTFKHWFGWNNDMRIMDLGCGLGEFKQFAGVYRPAADSYHGVDLNDTPAADEVEDYRVSLPNPPFEPNCMVSLFSIEACLPAYQRYSIYNAMFKRFPIEKALVAGFYYGSDPSSETIQEAGDLTSHQTIQPIEAHNSDLFGETRIVMRTPSKLFGGDVIEVWKILERKV